jgi:HSP20 family protein
MELVRIRNSNGQAGVEREWDALWNSFFGAPLRYSQAVTGVWQPVAEIRESKDVFSITLELPGIPKDAVKITLKEDVLLVEGERKESEASSEGYFRSERRYGAFSRAFRLGKLVDQTRISADYRDGLLELTLPKAEASKPREISIH